MKKGFKHTKETKEKMRQVRLGKKHSEETKKKIGKGNKGKVVSEDVRKKISENSPRYWLGKKRDEEFCKNISKRSKGKHYSPDTEFKKKEINCYEVVGGINEYRNLHKWVVKNLGKPTKCEHCGKDRLTGRQIHWANIDHKYKRDLKDWIRLCVKCHFKKDRI